jgi:lysophospholipase L1-like esterase
MAAMWVMTPAAFLAGCSVVDPVVKADIVFLGDSITARWNPLPIAGAANFGVSGETSEQVAARMPDVLQTGAKTVYILAGSNDILKLSVADPAYIESMAVQARDAGLKVFLATIPPTTKGLGASLARVILFNQQLIAWARANNFPVVDYYMALIGDYPEDTVDGIHPNAQGYALMATQIDTE